MIQKNKDHPLGGLYQVILLSGYYKIAISRCLGLASSVLGI